MCNHRYIGNYAQMPQSMGQRCPYPGLYNELLAKTSEAPPANLSPLPIDRREACLFHSQEIAWKRSNDFQQRFLQLVELLDAGDGQGYYDFAEFVCVGGSLDAESGSDRSVLRIEGVTFRKAVYFTAASFLDSLELDRVDFQGGATFDQATFADDLKVRNTTIRGLNLCDASMARRVSFSSVQFLDHALFNNAKFNGTTSGSVVKFEDSRFEGITDFSGAVFTLGDESSVAFWQIRFEDFTNFQNTQFHCHVAFDDVSFGYVTEFVDTLFDSIGSSARYRGSAVELKQIEVPTGAVLTFKSTNPRNKMFTHDVQISFKEEPAGTIRFDNVNFHKITSESRLRLTRLAKLGIVEIGAGCIKYRYQTLVRTVSVSDSNQPLVIELCQTFTNYFSQSNGLNLGFEIVERDSTKVSFFYFTDEDISEEIFAGRLAQTERRLWNLLSVRTNRQLLALEEATRVQPAASENVILNAVDGISALLGTFFRVGARIALGVWKAADTQLLLNAIRFNDAGAEDRAANLHRVLMAKYTGRTLLGISKRQNERLLPMAEVVAAASEEGSPKEETPTDHGAGPAAVPERAAQSTPLKPEPLAEAQQAAGQEQPEPPVEKRPTAAEEPGANSTGQQSPELAEEQPKRPQPSVTPDLSPDAADSTPQSSGPNLSDYNAIEGNQNIIAKKLKLIVINPSETKSDRDKWASGPARKVRILFLGANSLTEPLDLEREVRKIRLSLRLARERDNLEFRQEWAVTLDSLTQAMLDEAPNIVHFSGHGRESGIVLRDEMGEPRVVAADALASLFELFTDTVRCVVLNSCFSDLQARAIRRHIPYVVGMSAEIPDSAAVAFATGFYQAIGAGREIPFAFALGIAKIELEGVSGDNTPILL
jgi:hypothetical protein